eukprot:TRINITY_DN8149_c0_g1_i4.p3 TRINITY_DN8149_c0_g1~~TRINITY_DN8149_c0_g1_i4.p3  ORF type:complete len:241 (+),score=25.29 TRINITY_DN8149_c0_g1_i4:624-1346(+)
MKRSLLFHQSCQRLDPQITPETTFMMWLHRKVQQGEASKASAHQYCTYRMMALIDPLKAFTRSLTEGMDQKQRDHGETVPVERGWEIVSRTPPSPYQTVLAFQWATACRFVDMERLKVGDISWTPSVTMIIFTGGKTDRRSIPFSCPQTEDFFNIFGAIDRGPVFQGLSRSGYNTFLDRTLQVSSHDIRHLTLSHVARRCGHAAATAVARHRDPRNTSFYIPTSTWSEALDSKEGLQQLM